MTESAMQALSLLRKGDHLQWYVVPMLALSGHFLFAVWLKWV